MVVHRYGGTVLRVWGPAWLRAQSEADLTYCYVRVRVFTLSVEGMSSAGLTSETIGVVFGLSTAPATRRPNRKRET